MPAKREESEELEDLTPEDEVEELEDLEDEATEDEAPPAIEEDDEDGAASLDELLAQRAATRGAAEDADDDEDIMALSSERSDKFYESATARVIPIKDRQEFVCNRCHLVKAKSQLADPQRGLCRDCV